MARRSRPPRQRKSRKPEAPQHDVAVALPPEAPIEESEASDQSSAGAASDELAELDAGWD